MVSNFSFEMSGRSIKVDAVDKKTVEDKWHASQYINEIFNAVECLT